MDNISQAELDYFENLFKEFNVNFTKANQNSILRLRQKMSKEEVESYLKELYKALKENSQVKNFPGLFSKKLEKEERQINSIKQKNANIELEELDYFENLFKEFNVNFTKANQNSILRLRQKMSKEEVESYLKELYKALKENSQVKNFPGLFSKKLEKGERQLIRTNEENVVEEIAAGAEKKVEIKEDKIDIMEKFNSLDEYDKLKVEEKAINELLKIDKKIDIEMLMILKNKNINIYMEIILPYICL